MNPDCLTRNEARVAMLEWCSVEPQRDEVYCVWKYGTTYRYPEVWVMRKAVRNDVRFYFYAYTSASLKSTPEGICVLARSKPEDVVLKKARWMSLLTKGHAVYRGHHIYRDTGKPNA
jgi:hypothetical protein